MKKLKDLENIQDTKLSEDIKKYEKLSEIINNIKI